MNHWESHVPMPQKVVHEVGKLKFHVNSILKSHVPYMTLISF